jgi:hypothetical protein
MARAAEGDSIRKRDLGSLYMPFSFFLSFFRPTYLFSASLHSDPFVSYLCTVLMVRYGYGIRVVVVLLSVRLFWRF